MAMWPDSEPMIVEVLGVTDSGSGYFVRYANSGTIGGCRTEWLKEFDSVVFHAAHTKWKIADHRKKIKYLEDKK